MENLLGFPVQHTVAMLAMISAAFVVAGMVKGVVGLGLPTIAVGLLSLMMTPTEAASVLLLPSFVTNVWQLAAGGRFRPLLYRLWPLLAGVCVGTLAGGLLPLPRVGDASAMLGMALVLYAIFGLASVRMAVPARAERWMAPLAGLGTGVVTAATGVFVIPAVPYLQALGLAKEDLVQALGLAFTTSTIALGVSLALSGAIQPAVAGLSVYALIPSLLGMFLGQRMRTRIQPALFRRCFFAGLLALGMHLALWP